MSRTVQCNEIGFDIRRLHQVNLKYESRMKRLGTEMNILAYDSGYKRPYDDGQNYGFVFALENAHATSSDLIDLHLQNIKKRMAQVKHDRVAWEAAATAMCRALDFMLLRITKVMEYNLSERHKRVNRRLTASTLTAKQMSAMQLVAKGLKNQKIAEELGISVPAVSQILSRSYRVLGVRNRYEAVVKCRENSWI